MRPAALAFLTALPLAAFAEATQPWQIQFELSPVWIDRNDVRIPNPGGTKFKFSNLTGNGAETTGRIVLTFEQETGPGWRILYAPLEVSGTGTLTEPTTFRSTNFNNTDPTRGFFKFNSYRLTYRNRWKQGPNADWRVGFTLKVRDAEVRLQQNGTTESEKNTGFVPLLHVYGEEDLPGPWSFILDADGLAAPQGRAFDIALQLAYDLNDRSQLLIGYRTLEGGVDNDKVYNFFWGNYITFGYQSKF